MKGTKMEVCSKTGITPGSDACGLCVVHDCEGYKKFKKIKLSDKFEIKNYKEDFLANKIVAFELIEGVIDEMIKETFKKNPTFLIKDYDKMINVKDLPIAEKDKIYIIPINNNKPVKVYFE